MRNDNNTPRLGMIAALGAITVAIWLVAVYSTYHDTQEPKYNVRVRPGTVSYGTHSTATMPVLSVPAHRSAAPMISGGAVRSYAHYGHAAMPTASSNSGQMHTTSSATVHTIGSGGTAGGGGIGASGGSGSTSSRGIRYGSGGGASIPGLAMVTPIYTSSATAAGPSRYSMRPRRMPGAEVGDEGDWQEDTEGWWYKDEDGWVAPWIGATRPAGDGNFWKWDGTQWVLVDDQGDPVAPSVPLGDAPWLWMLLLALGYGSIAGMTQRKRVFLPKVGQKT